MLAGTIREFPKHVSLGSLSSGLIAWLFGVTGPLLIVLQAATEGHLSASEVTSWIFGIYVIPGLMTLLQAFVFQQPIGYAFSIPGAVLIGATLVHHSYAQVIGAYIVAGLIILLLGLSGVVERVMRVLPMPVMMGMVSGVLLPFGVGLFKAVVANPMLNGIPLVVFLLLSFAPGIAKKFPPILGAVIATGVVLALAHEVHTQGVSFGVAAPHLYKPAWSVSTMGQLVLPLVLTVVAIQNAQGIAVLKSEDYTPPINSMTRWSGIGSVLNAFLGAHTTCIAGPMTALLAGSESGRKEAKYTAAVTLGVLSVLFGLFAPLAASIPHMIPTSTIQMLGGIAMISVLTDSLHMSFVATFKKSALFSFLITVSGVTIARIGAPFWGLVGGTCVSFLLEKGDYKKVTNRELEHPPGDLPEPDSGERAFETNLN
ncbi:benzoate/H(+) symporter BenE family transporter [Alicyclobacillus fastidiosus]|uniref:Benzoate/H(+) symporter BenE family transporter n=1 Tax=Alicyclobacillus fastidiosus TaxID=392011 RepID=A0ABY6ZKS3_9BACL|nr:benzoate/H(+) symporter BenE family transporter [Alicyclobacillus fastidiosus]WAH42716.1 benzoate/H(+) symporter BenE family transporter [Alicyclobacillus fastidiosus]GMA64609.1 benzoate transporter [Alicyclobacillus fastidiosus]